MPEQVPGTRLTCLEDPSFEFEAAASSSPPKRPSYRVLEDPFESDKNFKRSAGSYKVLEDPAFEAGPPASSSGRPMASEVLEGARERFDKFWGGKSKPESAGDS
jgi:hypothetical protein